MPLENHQSCSTSNLFIGGWQQAGNILKIALIGRYRPRFVDHVGHESMYASSGNKHFFTKLCHHQSYQNFDL